MLALVLVPPMLFALVDPDVFFGALDTAGTFGISLLFGLVPAVMAWKQRYGSDRADVVAPPMVPGGRVTLVAIMGVAAAIIGDGVAEKVAGVVG